jgi:hypothetical protein
MTVKRVSDTVNGKLRRFVFGCITCGATGGTLAALLIVSSAQSSEETPSESHSLTRLERIEHLLEIMRDGQLRKKDPDRILSAIVELRDMKAGEAVDDLVGLLTYAGD